MEDIVNEEAESVEQPVDQCLLFDISCWNAPPTFSEENACCNIPVPEDGPPVRKLFIAGFPKGITRKDLRVFFGRFGKVRNSYIPQNKGERKKRYGFVTFQSPEDALEVLKQGCIKPFWIEGCRIIVEPADSCHQPIELPDGKIIWWPGRNNTVPENEWEKVSGMEPFVQEVVDVDESLCRVHILNDDCLMHVFSFLSKRERIKIERVCKRWQAVASGMWVYEQHINISEFFPWGKINVTGDRIYRLLQRCGPNLASLNLSYKSPKLSGKVLSVVARCTPNLNCLNLSGMLLSGDDLRVLSKISRKLRDLNLSGCSGLQDRDLSHLFRNCPMLETVILSHNNLFTGKCLKSLNDSNLTSLVLKECNNLYSEYLVDSLQKLKKLESLTLTSCINLSGGDVADIARTVPQLTSLSLERYFPLMNFNSLYSLNQLHNLVSLQLNHNPAVNNGFLEAISKSCLKLKKVDISGCSSASSGESSLNTAGLKCLAKLPLLENLAISYLANVSDDALDTIADNGLLKTLECRGCPTFTDAGCMRVVALCNELEFFDFSGCDYVSDCTILAAKDAVKMRMNNVHLTLVVGGTRVTIGIDEVGLPPLLALDFQDLCEAHLRPDFVDDFYFPPSDDIDDDDENFMNGPFRWDPWDHDIRLLSSDDDWEDYDFFDELFF